MKIQFTTPEIQRILGIPRPRLKEWIARGHIIPSVQRASGRGTKHIFSLDDLYVISLYHSLVEHGVRRKLAAEVVHKFFYEFYNFSEAIAENLYYLVFIRVAPAGEESSTESQLAMEIPVTLPPTMEFCWAFNLMNIKEKVDNKLS